MKVSSFLKIAIASAVFTLPANASFFFGGGAGITDGAILETGYQMNSFFALRARGTYLPSLAMPSPIGSVFHADSGSFKNIDNIKVDSKTFDIGAEITPIPLIPILSSFKLIGAMQYMKSNLTIGNSSYNAVISNKNTFAPYFALGIDIINLPIVSLRTTFGGSFRSFEVQSTNATDVDKAALSSKIDGNIFSPSASITLRATLPDVPFVPFI